VNEPNDKPTVRWSEERVERLMLKIFGDPPHAKAAELPPSRPVRHRWSHWLVVATCASILLLLAPVLSMWRDAENRLAAERASESTVEEIVVAELSDSEEAITSDEASDEVSSEEPSESESDSESSEASSS
jgi:hypothetical protein